jgi:hypothetical protein
MRVTRTIAGLALGSGLAAVLLATSPFRSARAEASGPARGTWTAHPARARAGASEPASRLQLELRREGKTGRSNHSFPVSVAELSGLGASQLVGRADVRFELRRDAGTLSFEGRFDEGRGAGHFGFSANPEFADALRRLGHTGLDDEGLFSLAMHDVSRNFIAELADLGYAKLSLDELVSLRIHGASPQFIRELKTEGYAGLSVDNLVSMRIHGVSPGLVREVKALGYERLSVDDLVSMRIHGVSPEFMQEIKGLGYSRPSIDQLVSMRIHGVSPAFVRELGELGYTGVPVDDLVSLRIHGVTPEFVRRVNGRVGQTPVGDLVSMKIHGRDR